jgi:hypothetical protein
MLLLSSHPSASGASAVNNLGFYFLPVEIHNSTPFPGNICQVLDANAYPRQDGERVFPLHPISGNSAIEAASKYLIVFISSYGKDNVPVCAERLKIAIARGSP